MVLSGDTAGLHTHGCEWAVLTSAWRAEWDSYIPCGSSCTPSLHPAATSPSPGSVLGQYPPTPPSQTHTGLSSEELWSGTGNQTLAMSQVGLTSCRSHSIRVMLFFPPPLVTSVGKLHPAPPILLMPALPCFY